MFRSRKIETAPSAQSVEECKILYLIQAFGKYAELQFVAYLYGLRLVARIDQICTNNACVGVLVEQAVDIKLDSIYHKKILAGFQVLSLFCNHLPRLRQQLIADAEPILICNAFAMLGIGQYEVEILCLPLYMKELRLISQRLYLLDGFGIFKPFFCIEHIMRKVVSLQRAIVSGNGVEHTRMIKRRGVRNGFVGNYTFCCKPKIFDRSRVNPVLCLQKDCGYRIVFQYIRVEPQRGI